MGACTSNNNNTSTKTTITNNSNDDHLIVNDAKKNDNTNTNKSMTQLDKNDCRLSGTLSAGGVASGFESLSGKIIDGKLHFDSVHVGHLEISVISNSDNENERNNIEIHGTDCKLRFKATRSDTPLYGECVVEIVSLNGLRIVEDLSECVLVNEEKSVSLQECSLSWRIS